VAKKNIHIHELKGVGNAESGSSIIQNFNLKYKVTKFLEWSFILLICFLAFSLYQNKNIFESTKKQEIAHDLTHKNQSQIKDLIKDLAIYGNKEKFLKAYFGDDWKKVLENPQTYNNLKIKLLKFKSDTEKLIDEKNKLNKKIESQKLNSSVQKMIDKAFNELRFDDVRDLLDGFIKSNKGIESDLLKVHYLKALSYIEESKYQKAKEEFEKHIPVGIEDVQILNDYGHIYFKIAEYKKSETFLKKALSLIEEECIEVSPKTSMIYYGLGELYLQKGKYKEAETFYLKALKIDEQLFGINSIHTSSIYNGLGILYSELNKYEKAEYFYIKSLNIDKKVLGENHPNVANSYNNLASFYESLGDLVKAKEFYLNAIKIGEKIFGKEHIRTAIYYDNAGRTFRLMGDLKKSEELHLKALKIFQEKWGDNHPDIASTYYNLAGLYESIYKFDKAEKYYLKSLHINKKFLSKNNMSIANINNALAGLYHKNLNRYDKAEKYYLDDLTICEKVLDKNSPRIAEIYFKLSILYMDIEKFNKAYESIKKTISIEEKNLPMNHPNLEVYRQLLTVIQTKMMSSL